MIIIDFESILSGIGRLLLGVLLVAIIIGVIMYAKFKMDTYYLSSDYASKIEKQKKEELERLQKEKEESEREKAEIEKREREEKMLSSAKCRKILRKRSFATVWHGFLYIFIFCAVIFALDGGLSNILGYARMMAVLLGSFSVFSLIYLAIISLINKFDNKNRKYLKSRNDFKKIAVLYIILCLCVPAIFVACAS